MTVCPGLAPLEDQLSRLGPVVEISSVAFEVEPQVGLAVTVDSEPGVVVDVE